MPDPKSYHYAEEKHTAWFSTLLAFAALAAVNYFLTLPVAYVWSSLVVGVALAARKYAIDFPACFATEEDYLRFVRDEGKETVKKDRIKEEIQKSGISKEERQSALLSCEGGDWSVFLLPEKIILAKPGFVAERFEAAPGDITRAIFLKNSTAMTVSLRGGKSAVITPARDGEASLRDFRDRLAKKLWGKGSDAIRCPDCGGDAVDTHPQGKKVSLACKACGHLWDAGS